MIKPLNKTTLSEEVIKIILNKIRKGQWRPGDKIPGEISLAESFQLSRNSLREALKFLELSGILHSRAGKGTFLTEDVLKSLHRMELIETLKNDSTLIELIETRLTIEPQLAYFAAERMSPENIKKLENSLEKSKKAIEDNSYTTMMGWEFHQLIGEAADNKILSNLLTSITEELRDNRFTYAYDIISSEALLKEIEDHEIILEHIKNKEAKKVKNFIYDHINNRLDWLKKQVKVEGFLNSV